MQKSALRPICNGSSIADAPYQVPGLCVDGEIVMSMRCGPRLGQAIVVVESGA